MLPSLKIMRFPNTGSIDRQDKSQSVPDTHTHILPSFSPFLHSLIANIINFSKCLFSLCLNTIYFSFHFKTFFIMFNCDQCPLVFIAKHNLVRHGKIHAGIRFPCAVCTSTFSSKWRLIRHQKNAHGIY